MKTMTKRKRILLLIIFVMIIILSILIFIYGCFNKRFDLIVMSFMPLPISIYSLVLLYKAK